VRLNHAMKVQFYGGAGTNNNSSDVSAGMVFLLKFDRL